MSQDREREAEEHRQEEAEAAAIDTTRWTPRRMGSRQRARVNLANTFSVLPEPNSAPLLGGFPADLLQTGAPRARQHAEAPRFQSRRVQELHEQFGNELNVVTGKTEMPRFFGAMLDRAVMVEAMVVAARRQAEHTLNVLNKWYGALEDNGLNTLVDTEPELVETAHGRLGSNSAIGREPIAAPDALEFASGRFADRVRNDITMINVRSAKLEQVLRGVVQHGAQMRAHEAMLSEMFAKFNDPFQYLTRVMYPSDESDMCLMLEQIGSASRSIKVAALPADFESCPICTEFDPHAADTYARIEARCEDHEKCRAERFCTCASYVYYHYACLRQSIFVDLRGRDEELDGYPIGVAPRPLPRCPTCRLSFCYTDLVLVRLEPHKRKAQSPEAQGASTSTEQPDTTPKRRRRRVETEKHPIMQTPPNPTAVQSAPHAVRRGLAMARDISEYEYE